MDSSILWTNLTLKEIQEKLITYSILVSIPVIKATLKELRFGRRKMRKCRTLKEVENRDKQFKRIARLITLYTHLNLPIFSIDTKKKEVLGNFYRDGKVYCNQALPVNDHDFISFADGVAVPHGIYDLAKNKCYLSIGTNKDTAKFVSDNFEYHWFKSIANNYPNAKKILILCDGGGSNSSSHYVVKEMFKKLAEKLQIEIKIAHYPPYCSKWNPIEHRAFSFLGKKWQGWVFRDHQTIKELSEQTKTKKGFSVEAYINFKEYQTGRKASEDFMEKMPVIFSKIRPKWNYKFAC